MVGVRASAALKCWWRIEGALVNLPRGVLEFIAERVGSDLALARSSPDQKGVEGILGMNTSGFKRREV